MLAGGCVPGQPDGREMTPPELANDDISAIVVCLTDGYWVVAAFAIIFRVFFFCGGFDFVAGGGRWRS